MPDTQKERPEVRISRAGVHYVRPADIFASKAGQARIRKMNRLLADLKKERSEKHDAEDSIVRL